MFFEWYFSKKFFFHKLLFSDRSLVLTSTILHLLGLMHHDKTRTSSWPNALYVSLTHNESGELLSGWHDCRLHFITMTDFVIKCLLQIAALVTFQKHINNLLIYRIVKSGHIRRCLTATKRTWLRNVCTPSRQTRYYCEQLFALMISFHFC